MEHKNSPQLYIDREHTIWTQLYIEVEHKDWMQLYDFSNAADLRTQTGKSELGKEVLAGGRINNLSELLNK